MIDRRAVGKSCQQNRYGSSPTTSLTPEDIPLLRSDAVVSRNHSSNGTGAFRKGGRCLLRLAALHLDLMRELGKLLAET